MSIEQVLYKAHATATGGREGKAYSSDHALEATLTTPRELGGNGAAGTNPEQLFAAGYAACFIGAMKFVAGQKKIALPVDTSINSTVGIPKPEAEALVEAAHHVCPYSNATRGNIDVRLSVV